MSGATGDRVQLFRAVGLAELADIRRLGGFRPGSGTMETKLFATTLADALHSGRLLYAGTAAFAIVEVTIPAGLANQLDRFMADRMAAIAVYPEQLATFNRTAIIRFPDTPQEQEHG